MFRMRAAGYRGPDLFSAAGGEAHRQRLAGPDAARQPDRGQGAARRVLGEHPHRPAEARRGGGARQRVQQSSREVATRCAMHGARASLRQAPCWEWALTCCWNATQAARSAHRTDRRLQRKPLSREGNSQGHRPRTAGATRAPAGGYDRDNPPASPAAPAPASRYRRPCAKAGAGYPGRYRTTPAASSFAPPDLEAARCEPKVEAPTIRSGENALESRIAATREWLATEPPGTYSIQLLGSQNTDTAKAASQVSFPKH